MLEIRDLTVEIEGKEILTGIDISIPDGKKVVLFGPNGVGKSALIKTIMGFDGYKVKKGSITLDGEDITDMPVYERARKGIGIMLQRPPNMTGVRLGDLIGKIEKDDKRMAPFYEKLDMERFKQRDINVGFSGGEIKRSELLQLAAQDPKVMLLDEPESGVDLVSVEGIGKTINDMSMGGARCSGERKPLGKSALIITHTGHILEHMDADLGYMLKEGTIMCSGNPYELLDHIKTKGYEEGCKGCRMKR